MISITSFKIFWNNNCQRPLIFYVVAFAACLITVATEKNYKINLDKFVMVSSDDAIGNFSAVKMVKYNRSTSALSGTFDILVDADPDLSLSIEGYEKVGNQYVLSGIQVKEDVLCDMLEIYRDLIKFPEENTTNFDLKCPIVKGSYYIQNYRPDEDSMPEDVPGNDWKFDVKFRSPKEVDKVLLHAEVYVKIERVVSKWKPSMK